MEREFRAWSGSDEARKIEFDMPAVDDIAKVGTLLRYMRMLCDDLRSEASTYPTHWSPTAWHRDWSLFSSMPHNKIRANVAVADQAIAPFFVRRVELFIEQHAGDDIALADLTGVAGCQCARIANRFSPLPRYHGFGHLGRGGPGDPSKSDRRRLSFTCSICDKRHTPVSVRFLGRRVYRAATVVLASALRAGLSDWRVKQLRLRIPA